MTGPRPNDEYKTEKCSKNRFLSLIFFTGLILRVGLTIHILNSGGDGFFYKDSPGFFYAFINLIDKGFYGLGPGPDPLRPPLYPFFCYLFSFFGQFPSGIAFAQSLLVYPLTFWCLYSFVKESKLSWLLMAFLSFNVSHIVYGSLIMADTLFVLEVILLLKLLKNSQLNFKIGCLLGLLHLTRPLAWPILFSLLSFHFIKNRRLWRPVAHFFAGFLLVISPWIIRNTITFGEPFFSLLPSHTLFKTLVPPILAPGDPDQQKEVKEKLLGETGDIHEKPLKVIDHQRQLTLEALRDNFEQIPLLAIRSMVVFLWNPERSSWVELLDLDPLPGRFQFNQVSWKEKINWLLSAPLQLLICLFQLIFLSGIWILSLRNMHSSKLLPWLIVIGFTLICWVSGPSLTARKRMPLVVILPLLASSVPLRWQQNVK